MTCGKDRSDGAVWSAEDSTLGGGKGEGTVDAQGECEVAIGPAAESGWDTTRIALAEGSSPPLGSVGSPPWLRGPNAGRGIDCGRGTATTDAVAPATPLVPLVVESAGRGEVSPTEGAATWARADGGVSNTASNGPAGTTGSPAGDVSESGAAGCSLGSAGRVSVASAVSGRRGEREAGGVGSGRGERALECSECSEAADEE